MAVAVSTIRAVVTVLSFAVKESIERRKTDLGYRRRRSRKPLCHGRCRRLRNMRTNKQLRGRRSTQRQRREENATFCRIGAPCSGRGGGIRQSCRETVGCESVRNIAGRRRATSPTAAAADSGAVAQCANGVMISAWQAR